MSIPKKNFGFRIKSCLTSSKLTQKSYSPKGNRIHSIGIHKCANIDLSATKCDKTYNYILDLWSVLQRLSSKFLWQRIRLIHKANKKLQQTDCKTEISKINYSE